MPKLSNLFLAVIFTVTSISWVFNYKTSTGPVLLSISLLNLAIAAFYWGRYLGETLFAKSKFHAKKTSKAKDLQTD